VNEAIAAVIIALLVINLVGLLAVGLRIGSQGSENRALESRLTKLEARVENLPTHRDLADLRDDLSDLVRNVAEISGQAETQTRMLRSIQEHLLENNR
jgi:hypothetical protein